MQRLSGVDSMFWYMETPNNHMHVAGVFIIDPTTAPAGFSFSQVRSMVASRLNRAALFRRRAVEVPFGLAPPVWIEDPAFDLDYHVRRASLPSPGGRGELDDLLGQFVALPLDRQRPLWELAVVEGLEGGFYAVVVKVHHAAIDGISAAELAASWLDLQADPGPQTFEDDWVPERVPREIDLLVGAWPELVSGPLKALRAAGRVADGAQRIQQREREADLPEPPGPFDAPRTSFNAAITPHRRVAFAEAPLEVLKRVKNHFGCTVNDVVLAVCAGALRRYLSAGEELPDDPLVAFVPVAVRSDRTKGANRLSAVLTTLATDVPEPAERLRMIAAGMSEAKSRHSLAGPQLLTEWTEFTAPTLIAGVVRLVSSTHAFDRLRPAFNVTISNVPGPPFGLFLAGGRVTAVYPLGPVVEGVGLNMTVLSYCGTVYFGLNGCRETMPRIGELPQMISESLSELVVLSSPGRYSASRAGQSGGGDR